MTHFDTVTFLSDFGLADEFVGIVHQVIRRLAPRIRVIDLTHQVPAHDVRSGALTLWRAARWLAPGVVVAVVDPGVGTARRAVAVEAAGGSLVLVGPDNGLLTPAAYVGGTPSRAVALTDPAWHLPEVRTAGRRGGGSAWEGAGERGATFDGRDVFAPVAAHLCAGVDLVELGERFDPADLAGGPLLLAAADPAEVAEVGLDAEVLWVDRYGNAQLGVRPAAIEVLGPRILVRPGDRLAARARGYGELARGQLGLVADSADLVALCLDRASAAEALGLAPGAMVHLGPAAAAGA